MKNLVLGCLTALLVSLAAPVFAACNLETLTFYQATGGDRLPVPRTSGCSVPISATTAGTVTTSIPGGAKYAKFSYYSAGSGTAQLVADAASLDKFGSTAASGTAAGFNAWDYKPTFISLDAISATTLDTIKMTAIGSAISATVSFFK